MKFNFLFAYIVFNFQPILAMELNTNESSGQKVNQHWDAKSYAQNNRFQVSIGIELVRSLMNVSGKSIIDVGCGTGEVTAEFYALGSSKVIGIDQDKNMIKYARQHFPQVNFLNVGAQDFQNSLVESADFVTTFFMLHWLDSEQQEAALKNFHSYLKPGGELLIFASTSQSDAAVRAIQKSKVPHKAFWNLIGASPYLAWHGVPAFWRFFQLSEQEKSQLVGRYFVNTEAIVEQLQKLGFVDIQIELKTNNLVLSIDELIEFQLPLVESRGAMRLIENPDARKIIATNYIKYFIFPELSFSSSKDKRIYSLPRIFIRARKL